MRNQLSLPVEVARHSDGPADSHVDAVGNWRPTTDWSAECNRRREGAVRDRQLAPAGDLHVGETAADGCTVAAVVDRVAGIADTNAVDVGNTVHVGDGGAGGANRVDNVEELNVCRL